MKFRLTTALFSHWRFSLFVFFHTTRRSKRSEPPSFQRKEIPSVRSCWLTPLANREKRWWSCVNWGRGRYRVSAFEGQERLIPSRRPTYTPEPSPVINFFLGVAIWIEYCTFSSSSILLWLVRLVVLQTENFLLYCVLFKFDFHCITISKRKTEKKVKESIVLRLCIQQNSWYCLLVQEKINKRIRTKKCHSATDKL